MRPEDLFVFVGAGASRSSPSCLPVFNALRSAVLAHCGLDRYIAGHDAASEQVVAIADGLVPEPFLLAVARGAGRDELARWLRTTLTGEPNAAHRALGQLIDAGATVWTVNFDELIEATSASIGTPCSWPSPYRPDARLWKPHGTTSGEMLATSDAVLRGLAIDWETGLRAAAAGKTVVFLGYSGRDLDFAPVWDDALARSGDVLWFDYHDGTAWSAQAVADKRGQFRRTDSAGRLHFMANTTTPANPSADFVRWCTSERLLSPSFDADALLAKCDPYVPVLGGDRLETRASVQQVLGDTSGAFATTLRSVVVGKRRTALGRALKMTANHGGRPVELAIDLVRRVVPPFGRAQSWRRDLLDKELSIAFNRAAHDKVLRLTEGQPHDPTAAVGWVVRSGSLRYRRSVADAVVTAETALQLARRLEDSEILAANAALQIGLGLLWHDRLDELRIHLGDLQMPLARLASNRWVAWAGVVGASLSVRIGDGQAGDLLRVARRRFAMEGLVDGVRTTDLIEMIEARRCGDEDRWEELRSVFTQPVIRGAPGTSRTREYVKSYDVVLALEDAEFARHHRRDIEAARQLYGLAAASPAPLHAGLGWLGIAELDTLAGADPSNAIDCAREGAERCAVPFLQDRVKRVGTGDITGFAEVFYP